MVICNITLVLLYSAPFSFQCQFKKIFSISFSDNFSDWSRQCSDGFIVAEVNTRLWAHVDPEAENLG